MWRRERAEAPSAGVRCIYVTMWDCMRGGGRGREGEERERERGRGGGGEKQLTTLRQNHSTSTLSSKPLDKHSTAIDRHYKQEVMTEVSIRKVYRSRMDSLDVVSLY
jgi:hypothetical protein